MAALKGVPQRPHIYPPYVQLPSRGDLSWQDKANCTGTDPEAFFPAKGRVVTVATRAVCNACTVRKVCLEYALTNQIWDGVWGALSVEERKALTRKKVNV